MRGITKSFGPVVASDAVDLELRAGEIHALLGENGAGKTTLMRILSGLLEPDAGSIEVAGSRVRFRSPRDALRRGLGMVHQHSVLVPELTVAENIVLGLQSSWKLHLPRRDVEGPARRVCQAHGVELDPGAKVGTLSVDQVQEVEILRLLHRDVRTLILDEPTAVLGHAYVQRLFSTLARLRDQGRAVVVITHKLKEVMELADRATVLQAGSVVAAMAREDFSERRLTEAMIGGRLRPLGRRAASAKRPRSGDLLVASELTVPGDRAARAVDGLSFSIAPGEILGLAGVEGNGQRELVEALAGLRPTTGGQVTLGQEQLARITPSRLDAAGVAVISEDRLRWDVVPELSLAENMLLSRVARGDGRLARFGLLRRRRMAESARTDLRRFDVRPASPETAMSALSGGNQQKAVLARELGARPRLVIAANPTRGLDIAATQFVHRELLDLSETGVGVLLVSADLDELLLLADRIGVLYRGRLAHVGPAETSQMPEIVAAMTGFGSDVAEERVER